MDPIGRSIDKLVAEHFLILGNSRAHSYRKHWNREILEPNLLKKEYVLVSCLYKSGSHDAQAKSFEPHDPSMYTLSLFKIKWEEINEEVPDDLNHSIHVFNAAYNNPKENGFKILK